MLGNMRLFRNFGLQIYVFLTFQRAVKSGLTNIKCRKSKTGKTISQIGARIILFGAPI